VATKTGLDVLIRGECTQISGQNVAVVCNQASIAADCRHILEHLLECRNPSAFQIHSAFGPQHGLWGHTQDNMIEWEGATDPRFPFPIHSLYGASREPSDGQLRDADLMLIDLPDVGARYYTFIWTMSLCFKACERLGIPIVVLDRPNPIGGTETEGTVGQEEFASFVGLHPLPIRHGMTTGEIARHFHQRYFPALELKVVEMEDWGRGMYFTDTDLPWAMPSPNMPTPDTALVYPGGCLLEATNLSEGRGTTRPFEMFGAPFIDGIKLCERLSALDLPGAVFRSVQFQPTFNKFAGQVCEGAFVHVRERSQFQPFLTYIAILQETIRQYPKDFAWKQPPYEYEHVKLPIDILAGNDWLREAVEQLTPLDQVDGRFRSEVEEFAPTRKEALIY